MLSADVYKIVSDSIILLLLSHAPWGRCVPLLQETQGLSARRLLFFQVLGPLSPFLTFILSHEPCATLSPLPTSPCPVRVLPPQPPALARWPPRLASLPDSLPRGPVLIPLWTSLHCSPQKQAPSLCSSPPHPSPPTAWPRPALIFMKSKFLYWNCVFMPIFLQSHKLLEIECYSAGSRNSRHICWINEWMSKWIWYIQL